MLMMRQALGPWPGGKIKPQKRIFHVLISSKSFGRQLIRHAPFLKPCLLSLCVCDPTRYHRSLSNVSWESLFSLSVVVRVPPRGATNLQRGGRHPRVLIQGDVNDSPDRGCITALCGGLVAATAGGSTIMVQAAETASATHAHAESGLNK